MHTLDLGHRLDVGGGEYDPEPVTSPGLVAKVPAVGGWGSGWLGFEAFATIGVLALFCYRNLVCKYPGPWGVPMFFVKRWDGFSKNDVTVFGQRSVPGGACPPAG